MIEILSLCLTELLGVTESMRSSEDEVYVVCDTTFKGLEALAQRTGPITHRLQIPFATMEDRVWNTPHEFVTCPPLEVEDFARVVFTGKVRDHPDLRRFAFVREDNPRALAETARVAKQWFLKPHPLTGLSFVQTCIYNEQRARRAGTHEVLCAVMGKLDLEYSEILQQYKSCASALERPLPWHWPRNVTCNLEEGLVQIRALLGGAEAPASDQWTEWFQAKFEHAKRKRMKALTKTVRGDRAFAERGFIAMVYLKQHMNTHIPKQFSDLTQSEKRRVLADMFGEQHVEFLMNYPIGDVGPDTYRDVSRVAERTAARTVYDTIREEYFGHEEEEEDDFSNEGEEEMPDWGALS